MIGVGGIGMSALARYYKSQGFEVSGCDSGQSEIIDELRSEGVIVKNDKVVDFDKLFWHPKEMKIG